MTKPNSKILIYRPLIWLGGGLAVLLVIVVRTLLPLLGYRNPNLAKNDPKYLVSKLAFGSDGKTVASASADGTIQLWDLAGQPLGQPITPKREFLLSAY